VIGAYPSPPFAHLIRLSDDTGLLEHAHRATPMREHGYCVDDVARGLLVICREPAPPDDLVALAERYLAFVMHAQAEDGTFHNRMSYQRQWLDSPDTGDWWGRAIWGLGTAVARGPRRHVRDAARVGFERAIHCRSRWPRSMAFAGLGAAEVLSLVPDHPGARRLLADAVVTVGQPVGDRRWLWPEPRLSYANAAVAEVHLAAGQHLGDQRAIDNGLLLLGWLLEHETCDGHLSLAPVGGWAEGETRPGFDQQPIEAAALADACARAAAMTGDPKWTEGLCRAVRWFLGANDSTVELIDRDTGGCSDGLLRSGRSENQGAESTLALVSTLQHARAMTRADHGR
jgi:hypothetical protein